MTFRFDNLADGYKSSIEGFDSSGHYFCPYRPGMSPQEVEAVTKRIREEVKSSRLQQQIESESQELRDHAANLKLKLVKDAMGERNDI